VCMVSPRGDGTKLKGRLLDEEEGDIGEMGEMGEVGDSSFR
jgi:hypothetical protein